VVSCTGIEGVFRKADNPFPFDAAESAYRHFHQWESQFSLGNPSSLSTIHLFPMDSLVLLSNCIGIPLGATERIWFVLMFACMGWAFYYLMTILMPGRQNRIPRLVASLLYMFNPYVLANLAHGQTGILMALAIAPLSLGLFLRGLASKDWRGRVRSAALISLVNCLWVQGHIVITLISLVLFAAVFTYASLSASTSVPLRTRLKRNVIYAGMVGVLTFLLSLWWLIPYGRTYLSQGEVNWSVDLSRSVVETSSSLARLSEVGRLIHGYLPYMSFNSSWIDFWESAAGILIGFALMLIIFSSLLVYRRNGLVVLFGLLAVGSTVMAMGTKAPFGFFYGFLFDYVPLFDANRRPGNFQFLQVISCAVLLGLAMSWLWNKAGIRALKRREAFTRGASMCLVGGLILAYSWPMLTGNLDGQLKGIEIPGYYAEAREWGEAEIPRASRVLAIPASDGYVRYDWMPDNPQQLMADALGELLAEPVIVDLPGGGWVSPEAKQTLEALRGAISDNCPAYTMELLAVCNVRHILVRYDMQAEAGDVTDAELEQMEHSLTDIEGVSSARSLGELHFYEVDDEHFVPRIYTASHTLLVDGGWDELLKQRMLDSLVVDETAIFMSDSLSASEWEFVNECGLGSGSEPQASFEMVNPTEYRVKVANATEPFLLVFSESYHDQWKAYVNSGGGDVGWIEAFWRDTVPEGQHIMANGYANAWYIDPAELGVEEEFSMTLYYKPQSLFYVGLVLSGVALVVCIGILLWCWRWRRKPKTGG